MAKVTVEGETTEFPEVRLGDFWRIEKRTYVIVRLSSGSYSLVCLNDGDRWRNPSTLDDVAIQVQWAHATLIGRSEDLHIHIAKVNK